MLSGILWHGKASDDTEWARAEKHLGRVGDEWTRPDSLDEQRFAHHSSAT